ncbi:MAG: hypothetical protein HYY06_15265 [Deltaproteobacteria bacterium]|nr:hypothetical protein [Deltaproteobacteria bacterium]
MSSEEYRLLLLAVVAVAAVYLITRWLRSSRERSAPIARDPLSTVRQLARVGDVDALRHFLSADGSKDEVRGAAVEELFRLASGADRSVSPRAAIALARSIASVPADRSGEIVERVVADLRELEPATLSWLCTGPGLDKAGPLAARLAGARAAGELPPAAGVAISAALLGCGLMGARPGAFLAAYRRQIDVEVDEEEDGMGGTALFTDPFDEPCAVVSPASLEEEILVSTSGRVFLRRKVADERISEKTAASPARIERKWEIVPVPTERLAATLGECTAAIDKVISSEPGPA